MIVKLQPFGNGHALVLDDETLAKLGVAPGGEVEVTVTAGDLRVRHFQSPDRRARFVEAVKEANEQHGPMLSRLAAGLEDDEVDAALAEVNAQYGRALHNLAS